MHDSFFQNGETSKASPLESMGCRSLRNQSSQAYKEPQPVCGETIQELMTLCVLHPELELHYRCDDRVPEPVLEMQGVGTVRSRLLVVIS